MTSTSASAGRVSSASRSATGSTTVIALLLRRLAAVRRRLPSPAGRPAASLDLSAELTASAGGDVAQTRPVSQGVPGCRSPRAARRSRPQAEALLPTGHQLEVGRLRGHLALE